MRYALIEFRAFGNAIDQQGLTNNLRHCHARIERADRVLKDHADVAAALLEGGFVGLHQVNHRAIGLPVIDLAGCRFINAQQAAAHGGFARTRLAHNAQRLARQHRQRHAVHSFDDVLALGEVHGQVAHFQNWQCIGAQFGARHAQISLAPELEYRADQHACVVVLRAVENLVHRTVFDNLAVVHDNHAVGDFSDHAHVVGDEHHRHTMRLLQAANQVQNLGLRRHIQRRGWLVSDQQGRVAGQ